MNKKLIKKCNKLADLFLSCAVEWKALGKSLERTTNKEEIKKIKEYIKKKMDKLEEFLK